MGKFDQKSEDFLLLESVNLWNRKDHRRGLCLVVRLQLRAVYNRQLFRVLTPRRAVPQPWTLNWPIDPF